MGVLHDPYVVDSILPRPTFSGPKQGEVRRFCPTESCQMGSFSVTGTRIWGLVRRKDQGVDVTFTQYTSTLRSVESFERTRNPLVEHYLRTEDNKERWIDIHYLNEVH